MTSEQTTDLAVTVTMICPPVFYTPEYWETHAFDAIDVSAQWAVKPKVDLEASLDDRLGDVINRAAERFGLVPGEEAIQLRRETRASAYIGYIGFYTDGDAAGFTESTIYGWPSTLPVADDEGNVSQVSWEDVTYRDLLVSSEVGLITGDVRRPYLVPFIPQGDVSTITEVVRVAAEAVRLAREALPSARDVAGNLVATGVTVVGAKQIQRLRKGRASNNGSTGESGKETRKKSKQKNKKKKKKKKDK